MKKLALLLVTVLVLFNTSFSFAQISLSNYSTYNLEVIPYSTPFGNILTEKDIHLGFSNLTEVNEDGDLYIRVNFINSLKSNYLLQTAIPGTGFTYRLTYTMPVYRVSIVDNNGLLLLQKIYGGEKQEALYGEFESISSPEDLKFEWLANRDEFYAKLESQPEEPLILNMDEDLRIAVQTKAQEIATGIVVDNPSIQTGTEPGTGAETETGATTETGSKTKTPEEEEEGERRITNNGGGPRKNIYKPGRTNRPKEETDLSEPKLSTVGEQLFDLNGFIEVTACSKYSYQLQNNHPTATLTVYLQKKPELDPEEVIIAPNESKLFRGLPHKQSGLITTYQKGDFQEDQIDLKEQLNMLSGGDDNPRVISSLLEQYFTQFKPQIFFKPKFSDETDEVIGYVPENDQWKNLFRDYLTAQTIIKLSKVDQSKIIAKTEEILTSKALRNVSKIIEKDLESEDKQKLIYSLIKNSKNFRNITPLVALEFGSSLPILGSGINEYWDTPSSTRASLSFRLPFEWQLSKRKGGSFSTIHVKAGFESLTLSFNRDFQAYAIDPENAFGEEEAVIPDEQFALQAIQLSAGLAWKFYFPLPIIELEGGAFFSHKTRLLWGQDKGNFPRSIFSPENEIISDLVDLSSFRPYFGAKIAIPYYFSGYKFGCGSRLRNIQIFAAFRMYPVNFTMNSNYNVFIKDVANIDFIPIPLQNGQSKFLMQLMIGGALEF